MSLLPTPKGEAMKIEADVDGFMERMEARRRRVRDACEKGTEKMCDYVLEKVPPAPPAARKRYPFVSFKQWLFVVASIREGSMQVPYRRTSTLARTITTSVKPMGNDFIGAIGTDVVYAPWVISSESYGSRGPQAEYHKGVWWTLQGVVREAIKGAKDIYKDIVGKALD